MCPFNFVYYSILLYRKKFLVCLSKRAENIVCIIWATDLWFSNSTCSSQKETTQIRHRTWVLSNGIRGVWQEKLLDCTWLVFIWFLVFLERTCNYCALSLSPQTKVWSNAVCAGVVVQLERTKLSLQLTRSALGELHFYNSFKQITDERNTKTTSKAQPCIHKPPFGQEQIRAWFQGSIIHAFCSLGACVLFYLFTSVIPLGHWGFEI